jgi:hypothetical protein
MKFNLINTINEMAVGGSVGGGAVAATPSNLFGQGTLISRASKDSRRKKVRTRRENEEQSANKGLELIRTIDRLSEANTGENKFNMADVLSKLDAAEKKAKVNGDTVTFGLEDEDGNVIKVHVRADQAKEFEAALANMLAGQDKNEDDENDSLEIAEVIFNLKDKFDIVDAEWPEITGDEEEQETVEPGEEEAPPEGAEPEMEPDAELEMEPEKGAESALQQVIDVLKADAEAKKAEAEAKTAEARAKEAEYTAQASANKVKQEEEILDMEAYYKQKKEKEKEAKTLAQLAQYKHDQAADHEVELSGEELPGIDRMESVDLKDLAKLIVERLNK